jgi:hypothetical protein
VLTTIRSFIVLFVTVDLVLSCCLLVIKALVKKFVTVTTFLIKSNTKEIMLSESSPSPSQERTFAANVYTVRII